VWATVAEAGELIASRRWAGLIATDDEFGCWMWLESPDGYGPALAFFEAAYGELPEGMKLIHRCPNGRRGCVRPLHLDALPDDVEAPQAPLSQLERTRFARGLRDERDARRWSLARMGRHLGVSASTVRSWERGITHPPADLGRELDRKLGWDLEPRRFMVTLAIQRIVVARSAGAATRRVYEQLAPDGQQLKAEVRDVRAI
jgi:hypothetical protein